MNVPNKENLRITGTPSTGLMIYNVVTDDRATARRVDGFWEITHHGVTTRHAICPQGHYEKRICSWPTADCLDSSRHLIEKCHSMHTPKAVVSAALLTMAPPTDRPRRPGWKGTQL